MLIQWVNQERDRIKERDYASFKIEKVCDWYELYGFYLDPTGKIMHKEYMGCYDHVENANYAFKRLIKYCSSKKTRLFIVPLENGGQNMEMASYGSVIY